MIKKIFLILLALFLISASLYFYVSYKMNGNASLSDVEKEFEIVSGEGVNQISKRLEKEGLISKSIYFDLYIWKIGREEKIITGTYKLAPNMNIPHIVDLITSGKGMQSKDIKITIIEGWTAKQMAEYLAKKDLVAMEDFENEINNVSKYKDDYKFLADISDEDSLEGFLFPDTYLISPDPTAKTIIKKMLDNFNRKFGDEMYKDLLSKGYSMEELITMASIVERELSVKNEGDKADQKVVAGIFWQRLEDGHPLQSCATVNYVIGVNKKQLSYEDTRVDSPYNTYINKGLPPTPISNPGMDAIMASLYPKETDYYYFLNDPETGELFFSSTLDEHNRKKAEHGL